MKYVIVGGVAGGATAAARLRRLDEHAQIIVFERSGYISYANCGLPYYIGGVIQDKKELTLQTPSGLWDRFRVDARVHCEVTDIDPARKTVTARDLETGKTYAESYDKLLLAPGSRPFTPNLQGLDSKRLFTLRTVEDTLAIRSFVTENKPGSAVIVGGGFIGLEVAENLRELGIDVTIVQNVDQVLGNLDFDMASFVHTQLRRHGVKLLLNAAVTSFSEDEGGITVAFRNMPSLQCDMALLAVGVSPEAVLAQKAGIALGVKNAIIVNDKMETSVPDIYAVGDAVQISNAVTGKNAVIALAGPANKQGRIAADNMAGGDSRYRGSLGSSVIKVFDMTVASTGLSERAAKAEGIDCERILLTPSSHASYYPGGKGMVMKVLFDKKTLRLLGAQIVGYDGVDKRIDVLATAIFFGAKADQLKELDLSYAPPYSSAKDPVNMAGFVAENIASGKIKQFHWDEVASLPRNGSVTLLDTRTPKEYALGCAEGFVNIPVDDLRERMEEIDKSKPVYVMCQSGLRSYIACRILTQYGFDCYNFSGGYRFYAAVTGEKALVEQIAPCGMDKT